MIITSKHSETRSFSLAAESHGREAEEGAESVPSGGIGSGQEQGGRIRARSQRPGLLGRPDARLARRSRRVCAFAGNFVGGYCGGVTR